MPYVLRTAKPTVETQFAPAGFRIVAALQELTGLLGRDIYITSGSEKAGRDPADPHPLGEAVDVRNTDWTITEIMKAYWWLQLGLGPAFTVLFEVNAQPANAHLALIAYVNPKATGQHFHIQRRKGTTYP